MLYTHLTYLFALKLGRIYLLSQAVRGKAYPFLWVGTGVHIAGDAGVLRGTWFNHEAGCQLSLWPGDAHAKRCLTFNSAPYL